MKMEINKYQHAEGLLNLMGNSVSELEWFMGYISETKSKGIRTAVTFNNLQMHVTGDQFGIGELRGNGDWKVASHENTGKF